jgi:hypothetical protein
MDTLTISRNDAYYLLGHTNLLAKNSNMNEDAFTALVAGQAKTVQDTDAQLAAVVEAVAQSVSEFDMCDTVWTNVRERRIAVSAKAEDSLIDRPWTDAYKVEKKGVRAEMNATVRELGHDSRTMAMANQECVTIYSRIDKGHEFFSKVALINSDLDLLVAANSAMAMHYAPV